LNSVDLPTLGRPTMARVKAMTVPPAPRKAANRGDTPFRAQRKA
jgi:hypothetical protein